MSASALMCGHDREASAKPCDCPPNCHCRVYGNCKSPVKCQSVEEKVIEKMDLFAYDNRWKDDFTFGLVHKQISHHALNHKEPPPSQGQCPRCYLRGDHEAFDTTGKQIGACHWCKMLWDIPDATTKMPLTDEEFTHLAKMNIIMDGYIEMPNVLFDHLNPYPSCITSLPLPWDKALDSIDKEMSKHSWYDCSFIDVTFEGDREVLSIFVHGSDPTMTVTICKEWEGYPVFFVNEEPMHKDNQVVEAPVDIIGNLWKKLCDISYGAKMSCRDNGEKVFCVSASVCPKYRSFIVYKEFFGKYWEDSLRQAIAWVESRNSE